MLTGDNEPAAQKVAAQLGQIEVQANLKPADKAAVVQQFQADGHHVMMVGDGINDAPSLARADVGVAIGAGTDVAIDSADVVLVKSEPQDILKFLSLGRATTRKWCKTSGGEQAITLLQFLWQQVFWPELALF